MSDNAHAIWYVKANLVKEFQKINKELPKYHFKDLKAKLLGKWCSNQKANYKGKLKNARPLTSEQISFLENIPDWKWEINFDNIWQENADSVKEFIEKNKKYPEEKRLKNWCILQKYRYKSNKKRVKPLNDKQVIFLESIPDWNWELVYNEKWEYKSKLFKEFKEKYKKNPSVYSKNKKEKILGRWAKKQKEKYGLRKLNQYRISFLESIPGWKWKE